MMSTTAIVGFGMPGWQEILVILAIVLVLFGGKKLPELARGLGRGMRIFKDEVHGLQKDFKEASDAEGEQSQDAAKKADPKN